MKVLHLFSNVKFTGPAEPVINLCSSLKRIGHDVLFACGTSPKTGSSVRAIAAERGLDPITKFRLNKHLRIKDNLYDMSNLPAFFRESHVEIVHTHLDNDHLVGGRSARKTDDEILVIRSCYSGDGLKTTFRNQYSVRRLTDGVIVASESAREGILRNFGFPGKRIWVVSGAVDTDRFTPSNVSANIRQQFGLTDADFILGVVARIQSYRRFDVILKAMKSVVKSDPGVKLLIVGRGTRMRKVAVEPVRRMGLGNHVKFAGYQMGEDYVNTLACFNAMIFLMPGTDGTCRAVRETIAMGKPAIVARCGMLPEIVDHAVNGLVIDDTPDMLAGAIRHLARNRDVVDAMSLQALKKAREEFRLEVQARKVGRIYEEISKLGPIARSRK